MLGLNLFQVRVQLGQGSAIQVTKNMLRDEGVKAFYKVLLSFQFITALISLNNVVD